MSPYVKRALTHCMLASIVVSRVVEVLGLTALVSIWYADCG